MNFGTITTGDHCRIAWRAEGPEDAPCLILSNSLGTTMAMWEPQLPALTAEFRVIRYDTRGHGGSDVPAGAYSMDRLGRDVLELADALRLDRFSFCGLSLGGMLAQWIAWRASERIDRLVIANSSPFMGPPSAWDTRIDTVREQGMAAIASPVLERWFTETFRADHGKVAVFREMLIGTRSEGYAGCCAAIRDMDMRPVLGLIRRPVLVIGGTADPATPLPHTEALASGIRNARCELLDAAHLSNLEQPERFNELLMAFLTGNS
ncbi:3-oxoadipate enol-lactonase [Altererythrobacter soli]|uniref:3-oxoadipate enol-lactonase n=1 Tax=Croceibacterium soli TaxID=1739690 RepID=A0A6I4UW99_9SPHN|nr:3-oxoadipate enol-lactonase [Croceibacterium soli]MXP42029.1 3-oxoadipate enol-lactonase [Croceibacterium soli]